MVKNTMYRIIKRTPVTIINGGGKPDVEWKTAVYGEYFSKDVAEQALAEMTLPKLNLEIEMFQSFEERINTDYLD